MIVDAYVIYQTLNLMKITLAVIVGMVFALVIALRAVVLMGRRTERIEAHLDRIARKILREEEQELSVLGKKKPAKKKKSSRSRK